MSSAHFGPVVLIHGPDGVTRSARSSSPRSGVTSLGHRSPTAQMPCADCCRTVPNRLIETIGPFFGMVVGDDREQSAVVADDFRAAGLGHLLVVSGQNVAFVLALLDPLTRRTRPATRLVLVILTLLAFVTLTRFEASVLRAAVMAGAGVGAAVLGGPVDGRRALSLSVLLLVLIDPFLVRVLAFQLSVAATGGIVWGSGPLAGRLPGPAVVRVAVATTIAAQLAVAPLLIATFGPIPLAGLPANVLAGPVSGPIMMWGCTGGVFAGLIGGSVAAVMHAPTDWLVGWIRAVAAASASARAPGYGVGWAAWAMFCAALIGFRSRPRPPRSLRCCRRHRSWPCAEPVDRGDPSRRMVCARARCVDAPVRHRHRHRARRSRPAPGRSGGPPDERCPNCLGGRRHRRRSG